MALANQNRSINAAVLLVAACFCLAGMARVARPLCSVGPGCASAFVAPQLRLTGHTIQEVSPRNAQPRAPYATGLRAVAPVSQRYLLPRMTTVFVPLWPVENWPAHRRISHNSADAADPA